MVPGGTGNGSSNLSLVRVISYILFSFFPVNCLCLVLFIYLLLLHFGQKQKSKMIHCCISGCAGQSQRRKPRKNTCTENRIGNGNRNVIYLFYRNFLHENSRTIVSFLTQNFIMNFKKCLVRQLLM